LYNILIEICIPMKLVRLIKMSLNETYSRVRVGKYLSDVSLEALAATEFNKSFLDRQPRPNVNVSRNVGKPSHLEAAVCPRKLH
jgi:hypothetical protein